MTDIKSRSGLLSHTDTQLANGSGSITPAKHRDLVKSLINSLATLDEVMLRVTNMTTATPPVSPSDRDKYVVATGATGDWAGQVDNIAIYDANASPAAWFFIAVSDGLGVWNLADDTKYRWDAGASPAAWTEPTIDIDDAGSSADAAGPKVTLIGTRG